MAASGAASHRSPALTASSALVARVVALAVLLSLGLGACARSDGNPYGLTEFTPADASGPAAPAAGPTSAAGSGAGGGMSGDAAKAPGRAGGAAVPVPTFDVAPAPKGAVTYPPSDVFGRGAWVQRGVIVAPGSARQAVADAAMAYLSARVQASNTWRVDAARLPELATGQALSSARARVQDQRAAQSHSIGPFVVNLDQVTVNGDQARVSGCPFDGTIEISPQGGLLRNYAGGVVLSMDLARRGNNWQVSTFPADEKFCEAPAP
jgi:hypothetical protein